MYAVRTVWWVCLKVLVAMVIGVTFSLPATSQTLGIPTWQGSFTYNHKTYHYQMVGTNPSGGGPTQLNAYLVPLKVTVEGHIFDPKTVPQNYTKSVLYYIENSPIFSSEFDFTQGGTDLGQTQYVDAFQRGNFWGDVQSNTGYHLRLKLIPEPEQSITGNCVDTSMTPPVGGLNQLSSEQLQAIINNLSIPNDGLIIFVTYDVFVPHQLLCWPPQFGGYHEHITIGQNIYTYAVAGFLDPNLTPKSPVEPDVSLLSHEVAEWADDPLNNNTPTPCTNPNDFLEVGDPLGGHYDFSYTSANGFIYHLQDLAFITWFGAPLSTSVNEWFSFQNSPESSLPAVPCGPFRQQ